MIKVEMHFLPDVYVKCDVCNGKRYNNETLTVKYKGKNISEVLNMTVEQATIFFEAVPKIKKKLNTLNQVGPYLIQSVEFFLNLWDRFKKYSCLLNSHI